MMSRAPLTILLAEDDARSREVGALILEAEGYRVLEAANGSAALGTLCGGEVVDLLLSDITMPGGIDGIQLVQRLRNLPLKTRVVLASGDPKETFIDFPADTAFLPKPYDRQALLAAVADALPVPTPD